MRHGEKKKKKRMNEEVSEHRASGAQPCWQNVR